MGFRDRREKVVIPEPTPPKKVIVKPIKTTTETIKKIEKVEIKTPPEVIPEPIKEPEKIKMVYDKVGIVGDNEQIRIFKSKVKLKKGSIGQIITDLITMWNTKN